MGKIILFGATGLVGAYTAIHLKEMEMMLLLLDTENLTMDFLRKTVLIIFH